MANNDYITTLGKALVAYTTAQEAIVAEAKVIHAQVQAPPASESAQEGGGDGGSIPAVR